MNKTTLFFIFLAYFLVILLAVSLSYERLQHDKTLEELQLCRHNSTQLNYCELYSENTINNGSFINGTLYYQLGDTLISQQQIINTCLK